MKAPKHASLLLFAILITLGVFLYLRGAFDTIEEENSEKFNNAAKSNPLASMIDMNEYMKLSTEEKEKYIAKLTSAQQAAIVRAATSKYVAMKNKDKPNLKQLIPITDFMKMNESEQAKYIDNLKPKHRDSLQYAMLQYLS